MKTDKFYLVFILECLERIKEFTQAGQGTFMSSHLIQDAVLRNLPSKAMREEAAAADFYVWKGPPVTRFPRIQILTIAELFAGKKLDYPWWAPPETFKKAARRRKSPSDQERQGELL
jgi:hypothetical protein